MNSRIEVIFSFAAHSFLGHLAGVLIGLLIAAFVVPRLLKNEYRPFLRAVSYSAFGAIGGTLDYLDRTSLSEGPVPEAALLFSIFFIGTLILVAPFIYYRSNVKPKGRT